MLGRQAPGGGRMEMLVPGLLGCCMGLANLQNVFFYYYYYFFTLEQQGLGRFLDPKTCQQPCVHGGPIDAGLSPAEVWGYWECLVKKNKKKKVAVHLFPFSPLQMGGPFGYN